MIDLMEERERRLNNQSSFFWGVISLVNPMIIYHGQEAGEPCDKFLLVKMRQ